MYKFLLSAIFIVALSLSGSAVVFAQTASSTATTTSSVDTTTFIQQLQAQIAQLEAKLAEITNANTTLQQTVQTLQLGTQLHQGMSGEDVRKLQEVLATDPNLYSKDNVTGYYGALTTQAVTNFQKHFGLDSVGIVGPRTLEKINELLKEHNATSTQDLSENDLGDLGEGGSVSGSGSDQVDAISSTSPSNESSSTHESDSSSHQGGDN